ncbi:hypothetical protein BGZ97_008283, partial [Linnemannia gamsii]
NLLEINKKNFKCKDDNEREERTRKSKRLWARKYRLRRKVEEAASVLCKLGQDKSQSPPSTT